MAKREFIHKDNFWVDLQIQTPISIAMERNTITEQEIVEPVLDKIRAEIEEQVLESLSDGGDDWFTAEKVNECLEIIDKYKVESEGKE